MMKDIGSIYPLCLKDYLNLSVNQEMIDFLKNKTLYSLCSEALSDIAIYYKNHGANKVLVPSYTCHVVYDAFEQYGWSVNFYDVDENMRISSLSLRENFCKEKPTVVVAHPYYGMDFNEEEKEVLHEIKKYGCVLVVDLTQNIFSSQRFSFVDYYVGSLRKWLNIPDGGFLEKNNLSIDFQATKTNENIAFVSKQKDAMYLRGLYYDTFDPETKYISIRLNKEAEGIETIIPHNISMFSKNILLNHNIRLNVQARLNNFKILYDGIVETKNIKKVVKDVHMITTAPLYFPLYVNERKNLQKYLAQNHIYCPVLWSSTPEGLLLSDSVDFIYNHILVVPIDQRYSGEDMEMIVNIINGYKQ